MTDQPTSDPAKTRQSVLLQAVASLNALGTVWIIVLMLLINADIVMRTFFNAPIAGTAEMISFSIVGIVFLQLSHTLRTGSLTRSDVLLNFLEPRAPTLRNWLLASFNLIGAALLAIALWKFVPSLHDAWFQPERYFMGNPGFFTIPQWPLYALMAIGIAATIFQFTASAISAIRGETR